MSLSMQDHNDLEQAAQLVQGVIDRHTKDTTLSAMSLLCAAIHDIHVGEKYMGEVSA